MIRVATCLVLLCAACGGGGGGDDGDGGTADGDLGDGGGGGDGSLQPDAPPGQCGDGTRVRGEECDDHNNNPGDGCDSTCRVEPPAGAGADLVTALHTMNAWRADADVRGMPANPNIAMAALNHATYYVNNAAAYAGGLSAHREDPNYPNGFTGVDFGTRMSAAGFSGQPLFETMAFVANPTSAFGQWLNSVFHRVPLLHPNAGAFGYGLASSGTRRADVADFARGPSEGASRVVVWPPPDATGVPRSFDRTREGPNPPAPPGGGNITGPIVSVLFDTSGSATVTTHELRDAGGNLVAHTWLTPTTPSVGPYLSGSYAMYGDGPAPGGARYTVHVAGTAGGQGFDLTWSFTTQ